MVSVAGIETAYCFLHQKERVYRYSVLDWQRDDIEVAVAAYADTMDPDLLARLSGGTPDFLRDHSRFAADLRGAVETLGALLEERRRG